MYSNKWIEIDISAIENNLAQIMSKLTNEVKLIAVVKANAYGHGAVRTSQFLNSRGVNFFAVSYIEEALELRQADIEGDILIFSPLINKEQVLKAIENKLTMSITSIHSAEIIRDVAEGLNTYIKVHIKIETGLGRFGLNYEEADRICKLLINYKNIDIEGIYTHMAEGANNNSSYTKDQFNKFINIVDKLEQTVHFKIKHCANSAVFLNYPEMWLNAVRVGTLLSGQAPVGTNTRELDLKDPYKYKANIISINELKKGQYLGYYKTYRLKNDAKIAVIPVGFRDGLAVEVANMPMNFLDGIKLLIKQGLRYLGLERFILHIFIKGNSYPVRGKVFMQMALIELPLNTDVSIGDEVEVPIRKTLTSADVEYRYVFDGKPYYVEGVV